MRELARNLMVKTLKETLSLPKTESRSELLQQAEISLAGLEAAARDESITATRKQQSKIFKEEVRMTAKAIKDVMRGKHQ